MRKAIALAALLVILVLVNGSIIRKEAHLSGGRIVYLELAPVDPRSLMQGDYMALRFRLAEEIYKVLPKSKDAKTWRHDVAASDGRVVVDLDGRGIGIFKGLYDGRELSENEVLMRYRVRNGSVKFATNAFFFQEGDAKIYEPARFGQFRVDSSGELLLTAMYDEELNRLGPE